LHLNRRRWQKAFQAATGIDTGCFIWGAIVAFGLGALLAASEVAYNILKWCGAAYLCWLGFQLLLRPRRAFDTPQVAASSGRNWFVKGMLGNVLNPKMGYFTSPFYRSLSRQGTRRLSGPSCWSPSMC
jgi:threonine/homoserine/homoserine lactone efflux protein